MGAFVLPNAVISDDAPLESFVVPGWSLSFLLFVRCSEIDFFGFVWELVESVESSAGLILFPGELRRSAKPLCQVGLSLSFWFDSYSN